MDILEIKNFLWIFWRRAKLEKEAQNALKATEDVLIDVKKKGGSFSNFENVPNNKAAASNSSSNKDEFKGKFLAADKKLQEV